MPSPSFSETGHHNNGGVHNQVASTTGSNNSTTTALPETTVQAQSAAETVQGQVASQSGSATKYVDAGVVISFSVPLRGGLFNTTLTD